ncbi:hypothetical protein BU16DRAFT_554273 [Lophium mytilinum]|uniref:Uncharacterized protein n=1 Tax=Lophium mytilinum TaxID=390894 RepID=A0A6A6REN4_9PEZI|nr:hypothetical protein BU16DRAFT_554273 [Lophium mytilinum]
MSTTMTPSLTTLPAEIRQQIASNFFHNTIRTTANSDVLNTPWQLKSTCKLLQADVEKLEELWLPNKHTNLTLTSPAELLAMPALITKLQAKAASAGKTWAGFQEVELKLFHPTALAQTSQYHSVSYPLSVDMLIQHTLSPALKRTTIETSNAADEWYDARDALYPALDPDVTRRLALDLTLPEAVATALKRPERRNLRWLSGALDRVASMAFTLGQDYMYGYTQQPYVQMSKRKGGEYPRVEWVGEFPAVRRDVLGVEEKFATSVRFV